MYRLSNTFPTVYFFQEEDKILPKYELFLRKNFFIPRKKEKFLPKNWSISSELFGLLLRGIDLNGDIGVAIV